MFLAGSAFETLKPQFISCRLTDGQVGQVGQTVFVCVYLCVFGVCVCVCVRGRQGCRFSETEKEKGGKRVRGKRMVERMVIANNKET